MNQPELLRQSCGDLCQLKGETHKGNFLDYVTAEVRGQVNVLAIKIFYQIDCRNLFQLTQAIEDNGEKFAANPHWEDLSDFHRKELCDVRRWIKHKKF